MRSEEERERQVYSGKMSAIAVVEGMQTGDVLEYGASIVGYNPVFEGNFARSLSTSSGVPVRQIRRAVLLPEKPDGARFVTPVNGRIEPTIEKKNGMVDYSWSIRDAPAVLSDGELPQWFSPHSWIEISDFNSWKAVAEWGRRQYPVSDTLPTELEQEVARISQLPSRQDQILAALRFSQEKIRYLGMFGGVHSHRPYPLDVIVKRRFGDCKDKSLLLCAMLSALKFDAVPALVHTSYRHVIDEWPPSPHSFNHLITCVKLDGSTYWLDPTRSSQRGSLDAIYLPDYKKALVLAPDSTALTDLEPRGHQASKTHIVEEYTMTDYAGEANLKVTTVYAASEADATRAYFAGNSLDSIGKEYLNHYSRDYPDIEAIATPEYQDDEILNLVTVTENYRISNIWEERDDEDPDSLFADFDARTVASYIERPDTRVRTMPYEISHPRAITQVIRVTFPTDLDLPVEHVQIRNDAFHYDYSETYADNVIESTFRYRTLSDHVPPERIADYIDAAEKARDNAGYWVTIPKEYAHGDYSSNLIDELFEDDFSDETYMWIGIFVIAAVIAIPILIIVLVMLVLALGKKGEKTRRISNPKLPTPSNNDESPPPLPPR